MSKVRDFFVNLRKSTKITLISCVSFVLMTFLILCFFIISPITPADKAGSTYGRETVSGSVISTDVTTVPGEGLEVSKGTSKAATTTKVTTSHEDYVITITTGAGFYTGGRINTGEYDGNDYYQNNGSSGNIDEEEQQNIIGYYDPNSNTNGNGTSNETGNGTDNETGNTNNNSGETGNGTGTENGNTNNNSSETGNDAGTGNETGNTNNGGETGNGAGTGNETGNTNNGGENGNSGGNTTPEQPAQTPEQPAEQPVQQPEQQTPQPAEGAGEAAPAE